MIVEASPLSLGRIRKTYPALAEAIAYRDDAAPAEQSSETICTEAIVEQRWFKTRTKFRVPVAGASCDYEMCTTVRAPSGASSASSSVPSSDCALFFRGYPRAHPSCRHRTPKADELERVRFMQPTDLYEVYYEQRSSIMIAKQTTNKMVTVTTQVGRKLPDRNRTYTKLRLFTCV